MTLDQIARTRVLKDAAIGYGAIGIAVFPLGFESKVPATRNGCLNATTDLAQIEEWWTDKPQANIGIAGGSASGNLFFVDVDLDPEKGIDGAATMRALQAEHGQLPATAVSKTMHGWHLAFTAPEGVVTKNSAKRALGNGIDVRGEGGYIVGAPSRMMMGKHAYRWISTAPFAPAPSWLLERVTRSKEDEYVRPLNLPAATDDATPYGLAALQRHVDKVLGAMPGERRDTLNFCGYSCGQLAPHELPPDLIASKLEAAANSQVEPQSVWEVRNTLARAIADGMARPYVPVRESRAA